MNCLDLYCQKMISFIVAPILYHAAVDGQFIWCCYAIIVVGETMGSSLWIFIFALVAYLNRNSFFRLAGIVSKFLHSSHEEKLNTLTLLVNLAHSALTAKFAKTIAFVRWVLSFVRK